MEIGSVAVINGSVFSGGRMFLRDRDTIKGDAVSGDTVEKQSSNSVVWGATRSHAQLDIPQTATVPVLFGTKDTTVPVNGICDLQPGSYRDFLAYANATITLHPGNYTFNKFNVEPDVKIIMKVSNTERLNLSVAADLHFSDRTIMSFEKGTAFPYSVKMYSAQTGQLFIGNNCQIYGNIIGPDAEVEINSGTYLNGAVYGKKVVIKPDAVVCKPPLLQDLWHSEWAYTPSFDPAVLDYKAVVTDATTTLTISTIVPNGTIVTVNGQIPANPVNLTGTTSDIPILLNNPDQCGTTAYNLKVTKSNTFQIFVNDNSPCIAGREDGNSWATAYKDLQLAIDRALSEGKEIWLAEGTYKPTQRTVSTDSRSATFLVYSGIEIKGGFLATETVDEPKGSPYNTILTGDINGNDNSITSWPPTGSNLNYISDNVYHVITITGNNKSTAVHLTGFIVEHGVANSTGVNSNGGGIYIKNCNPTLEQIGVRKNIASSSGAGIYVNSNIKYIVNCLVKDNYSYTGKGAGLYIAENSKVAIDASIFDGNTTKDTSSLQGGSALYFNSAQIDIVNSIFTRNNSSSINGTVFNNTGTLKITNCTFAYNVATQGISGIMNSIGSTAAIVNTILWNSNNQNELAGSGFTVSYSCITKGYAGTGNILTDPLFSNSGNPEGIDGKYGNNDDGLQLSSSSFCIDRGTNDNATLTDILMVTRPGGANIDIGAYEYLDVNKCNKIFFGQVKSGSFLPTNDLEKLKDIIHSKELYYFSRSNCHRVLRAYVEKNEYTSDNGEITIFVQPTNVDGSTAASEIAIKLFQIGEENGLLVFQTLTPDYKGKRLLFTGDIGWHGFDNPWAYVIYLTDANTINFRVPHNQFR
jgi:hypothetical protein